MDQLLETILEDIVSSKELQTFLIKPHLQIPRSLQKIIQLEVDTANQVLRNGLIANRLFTAIGPTEGYKTRRLNKSVRNIMDVKVQIAKRARLDLAHPANQRNSLQDE